MNSRLVNPNIFVIKASMIICYLIRSFENGLARVMKIGRSAEGDKTLIDALAPGIRALQASSKAGKSLAESLNDMHKAALEGAR